VNDMKYTFFILALLVAMGCAKDPDYNGGGTGGTGGPAGTGGGSGGSGGSAGSFVIGPSGLPIPTTPTNVPQPAGTPGNLKVVNWAGFKSAVTYTFDDAQPSQIEHYAELQATGVHHTFFITSGSNTSSANFDSTFTQAVHDGHEMGNHTVHHCHADLTGCSNGSSTNLNAEIDDCNTYISGHFGQSAVWTAASPFGDTGYDAPDMTRFFLNRGTPGGTIAPNDNTDPFNLPCHAAVEGEAVTSFNAAIDSVETGGRWLIFLIHTINPTSANWYAPIDISVVTGSIDHAKSLGDVWIDTMANVGAYWRGQKLLSTATPATSGDSQTWTWTLPTGFPPGRYVRVTVDGGTLSQSGMTLAWDPHGYYEVALDARTLTVSP